MISGSRVVYRNACIATPLDCNFSIILGEGGDYTVKKLMNSERHYLVMISVAKCSDHHYILPQISLPSSDVHYSFFTVSYRLPTKHFISTVKCVISLKLECTLALSMVELIKHTSISENIPYEGFS